MLTFKVQDQIYHQIISIIPQDGDEHSFLQIYFMGSGPEEIVRRASVTTGTRPSLLQPIHTINPYIATFRTTFQRRDANTNQFIVVIRGDGAPPRQHQSCFNKPQTDEVAVLITSLKECTSDRCSK